MNYIYQNEQLFKVRFKNGYCEYVKAYSSIEARRIIKSGINKNLENEFTLQSTIESVQPIKLNNDESSCESCSG